jgi:uncharacterized RDD family membrane protein YckC
MKCPKCDYVGYEQSDRCRHCGYEFSLATPPPAAGFPMRPAAPAASAPATAVVDALLAEDLADAQNGDRLGLVELRRADHHPDVPPESDLPLRNRPGSGLFADQSPPPAPPPLAVRRATSDRPRSRPTTQVFRRVPASLLDAPAAEVSSAAAATALPPEPASVLPRLVAGMVDLALLGAIDLAVIYLTVRLAGLSMGDWAVVPLAPLGVFLAGLGVSYLAVFTACGGQTLGKMAVGLQVVSTAGAVPPGRALVRAITGLVGATLGGAGYLPTLFGGDRQALHDRLTDTRVIRVAR